MNRRDVIKAGIAAAAGSLVPVQLIAAEVDDVTDADRRLPAPAPSPRERLLLDFDWRFHLGHADDPAQDFGFGGGEMFSKAGRVFAPSRANFDDSAWQAIDLPHDWAVDLPFENARELIEFGSKPLGRSYPATSIGWYRKTFTLAGGDEGRRIAIDFDGVFRDCMVVLNGNLLGRNISGYAPFRFDVSDYLTFGGPNVLVVRVDATGREGWFYEGAGIYRHVWLEKTNPLHVAHWGSYVTSAVSGGRATITVVTELENDQDHAVTAELRVSVGSASAGGRVDLPARGRLDVTRRIVVDRPNLWSPDTPHLYTAATSVSTAGVETDRVSTRFGIRTVRFDANEGFLLNGKHVELKGTCNHQDHAGVGSALPDRLQYYRIETSQGDGLECLSDVAQSADARTPRCVRPARHARARRDAHCFRPKPEGVSQLERLIRRDRNHPCVFAWSIANEE